MIQRKCLNTANISHKKIFSNHSRASGTKPANSTKTTQQPCKAGIHMTPTAEEKFNDRYNHMKTALQQSGSFGRDNDH